MKKLYFTLILLCTILLFAIGVSASDIKIVDNEGNSYNHTSYNFYLPSHISPSEVTFELSEGITLSYMKDGSYTEIKSGQAVDFTPFYTVMSSAPVYMLNVKINGDYECLMFLRFASSLPSVNITTSLPVENILKYSQKDEKAYTVIMSNDGSLIHKDFTNAGELKIRGNATKQYAKKPFQMKLAQKADLFGMGSDKTWILLANYDDQSLIRNNVMYTIGAQLGIDTCAFQNVDLFINGEYFGIYLLCEKVEIDEGRIDIFDLEEENDILNSYYTQYATTVNSGKLIDSTILTEYRYIANVVNPSDISGGYLVELDNNYYQDELCYFTTEYGNHYVIKSPEYASQKEVEYIAKLFADMEEAIMSESGYNRAGKHYSEYIDIDSLASAYILQEFGRNYDAGSSSIYFYKDRDQNGYSKIMKGPLWDCDNTLGNIHKNGASSTDGLWAANRSIWSGLTKKSDFMSVVKEKYELIYDFIFDMIDSGGYVDLQVEEIGDSIYMEQKRWGSNNYEKWPLYYDGTHYDKWQSSQVFNFVSVYSKGLNEDDSTVIGYLCEHIEARANWLACEWGINVELRERSFVLPEIPDSGEGEEPPTSGEAPPITDGGEPTPDLTPDFEEPPAIDEAPSEKSTFIEWLLSIIVSIIKWIASFIKQE